MKTHFRNELPYWPLNQARKSSTSGYSPEGRRLNLITPQPAPVWACPFVDLVLLNLQICKIKCMYIYEYKIIWFGYLKDNFSSSSDRIPETSLINKRYNIYKYVSVLNILLNFVRKDFLQVWLYKISTPLANFYSGNMFLTKEMNAILHKFSTYFSFLLLEKKSDFLNFCSLYSAEDLASILW